MPLTFLHRNKHGAKIYEDPMDRKCVKSEDSLTAFQMDPYVNYQGDRYVGRDGAMYLVTVRPEEVDHLGDMVSKRPEAAQSQDMHGDARPPTPVNPLSRYINTIHVKRVLTDDNTIGLYYMDDPNSSRKTFYRIRYPITGTLTETKVLFAYLDDSIQQNITFQDNCKQNFELISETEAMAYSYNGGVAIQMLFGFARQPQPQRTTSALPAFSGVQPQRVPQVPSAPPMSQMPQTSHYTQVPQPAFQ